jgi:MFS transporter, MHS family, shikimate and dehydroshikimate transport protein
MVTTMATKAGSIRLVAVASMVGTTIEWYDFFLYGTAAALVFNRLYFPTFDPLAGTLAAFGTYTVGFVARPIGGIVIGHYGDRIGRKSMLVLTLIIMGVSTFGIGLLPTYSQIGPWAAVALVILRLAQGFGVGGEWGGAVLMAVEHAPAGARGFYGSWPQIGVPAGLLLSTAVFAQFARLPEDQFLSWGWRVPFLVSILLVGVGLIIRLRILETPAFTRVKEARTEARRPIVEVLQIRAAGRVLVGAFRHARTLQRRVAWIPTLVSDRGRAFAVHCDGAAPVRTGRAGMVRYGADHHRRSAHCLRDPVPNYRMNTWVAAMIDAQPGSA